MLRLAKILRELDLIAKSLEQISNLKDIDERRKELERQQALFVPLKQRLERGGKALELGEDYESIKDLRKLREQNRMKQSSLREELAAIRNDLKNSEEALTISEIEYRNKLSEQTQLNNTILKVRELDRKISELHDVSVQIRDQFEESERNLRDATIEVEKKQIALERTALELRDARKFLQVHAYDEKLKTALDAIKKCYELYDEAERKRLAVKSSWDNAILKKQQDQGILKDRTSLLNDVIHKYAIIEKNYVKANAFYENSLKGKSLAEWREICERNIAKLNDLDELYKTFQSEKILHEKLNNLHAQKLQMHQETRNLNLQDIEQTSKINEYRQEVAKLERRVKLLHSIQDLDAVRELLEDNMACPLCGSMTHPYTSGAKIPDPNEVQNQLIQAQNALENLRKELSERQEKTGRINNDISSLARNESELKNLLSDLNSKISAKVADLGLRIGTGISPFEEIDRVRQITRDQLQLARNAAETIETAQRDLKAATDDFEKIKQSREELTQFSQEATFLVQNDKTEEARLENESKSQEEITASLKRELISQLMPYGYKSLPEREPQKVLTELDLRLSAWLDGAKKRTDLEHELSIIQNEINALKKDRDNSKLRREALLSQLKASEADRETLQQQRVITFASRDPESELDKMNRSVTFLRAQLDERNTSKNSHALKLSQIQDSIHALETEMATGREQLQLLEVKFSKKMLKLGFKSEDDYVSSCLTSEERRDLQNKLKELTQTDIELAAEYENTRAKLLELQSNLTTNFSFNSDELAERVHELEQQFTQELAKDSNTEEVRAYNQELRINLQPKIQGLAMRCGFKDPFEESGSGSGSGYVQ